MLLGPFANKNYTERVLNIIKEKGFEDAIIEKLNDFMKKLIFLKSKILTIGVFFFYSTSAYPFMSDAKYIFN